MYRTNWTIANYAMHHMHHGQLAVTTQLAIYVHKRYQKYFIKAIAQSS